MNNYKVYQHETAHICGSIAYASYQAFKSGNSIELALKAYGINFDKESGELHEIPLKNQNKFDTRNIAAASAFGPIVQAGEKSLCDFINHNDTTNCGLSATDISTGKNYRGSAADLKVSMLVTNELYKSVNAVKQARINAVLSDTQAQEHLTLNDLFSVTEIESAIKTAKQQLLSVELNKGIHVRVGSEKYLEKTA